MVGPSTQEKNDEVSPVTSSFRGALRPQEPCGLLVTGEEWDRGMRAQAHLPVHTAPEPCPATLRFSVALRPQKPYGLLGMEEDWVQETRAQAHLPVHTAPERCDVRSRLVSPLSAFCFPTRTHSLYGLRD